MSRAARMWRAAARLGRLVATLSLAGACARPESERNTPWDDAVGPGTPDPSGRAYGSPPRFEDHPAGGRFRGVPAAPDLSSHPDASRFGAALWQGARRGPNFAGHYTIVSRRCGRLCREFVIVDARTGRVHAGLADTPPFTYRLDSRLIAFEAPEPLPGRIPCAGCSAAYYVWNDPRLEIVPPETWVGSAPPPVAVRPLIDSVRALERPLVAAAAPVVTRPTWDRLVIAARDGSRTVLADRLFGDSIDRVHVFLGAVEGTDLFQVQVLLYEGVRYVLVHAGSGLVTEIDAAPVISPDRARFVTASFSLSGHDPNRVRVYRVSPSGPELEWSEDAWGGGDPVWLDSATLTLDQLREDVTSRDGPIRRTRVELRLDAGGWRVSAGRGTVPPRD